MTSQITNPLLPGFYPDPSICRVGKDFYLVTSSFSFYPGVPIFHSTDLIHWTQIGHVLDRPSQLPLESDYISGGIYAPTIRYHEGIFYMITTNVSHGGNFIVTASDPKGPWSDPHWISDAPGIDPSLFWDDDGKAYYSGTAMLDGKRSTIWLSEIDLNTFALKGEKIPLWSGALIDCAAPEAPHIYKKDGWYYLLIAEGGTEHYHAVTIARSKEVAGPYTGYEGNPILTHRHLGLDYPIANVGHGDLVELEDGSWYMVMLATRIYGGYHKNMGRETFITPVRWDNEWPVISPGTGKVEWTYPAPDLPPSKAVRANTMDHFDQPALDLCWNFLGTPYNDMYKLENSRLKLRPVAKALYPAEYTGNKPENSKKKAVDAVSFVGRRQQHMSYTARANMTFKPESGKETAGLILLQNAFQSLRLEMAVENGSQVIRLIKGYHNLEVSLVHRPVTDAYKTEVIGSVPWSSDTVILTIDANMQSMRFSVSDESGTETLIAENIDSGFLGSETSGGFIGAYIGMFASGNGTRSSSYAEFDWFSYIPDGRA